MNVVLDIGFGLLILTAICFGGLGLYIAYVNYKRRDIRKARAEKRDQEHEAWLIGICDDAELFFSGSEGNAPKRYIS